MTAAATSDTPTEAALVDTVRLALSLAESERDTLAARLAVITTAEAGVLRQEAETWRRMFSDAGTVRIGFMDEHRRYRREVAGGAECECDHCEAARRVVFRPAGEMAKRGKG